MAWNKVSQVRAIGYIVYSVKRQTLLECKNIVVSIGKLNGDICSDDFNHSTVSSTCYIISGCRVTVTHLFWEQVQAGSTPVIPTKSSLTFLTTVEDV